MSNKYLKEISSLVNHNINVDVRPQKKLNEKNEAQVYVELRRGGHLINSAWATAQHWNTAIAQAVQQASRLYKPADKVILLLAHHFTPVSAYQLNSQLSNVHRGVRGLEIVYQGKIYRVGPTEMISTNRSLKRVLETFVIKKGITQQQLFEKGRFRLFEAKQIMVTVGHAPSAQVMFRGNQLVSQNDVNYQSVVAFKDRMSQWMSNNVQKNGRMLYKYWPSRGVESNSNNMIRQWMASVCLARIANNSSQDQDSNLSLKNIQYNLDHFYKEENDLGFIQYTNKVKLGAVALSALALLESKHRSSFSEIENKLLKTIYYLWQDDGSFITFLKPPGRNDNQNFYSGEALLYLAFRYRNTKNPDLLKKIMKSADYYKKWHLANRNPAFIPWHTQAYYIIWEITKDKKLERWIFEMNDWLLGMQSRSAIAYPDTQGRFYDPTRPFGPPHASATGVYLEGLIDAYKLAKKIGNSRAESYRLAILKGIRSAMQLEFRDGVDLFYITKPLKVRGGLRTTVYNNEIRVDNIQHTLMGIQKITDEFSVDEYSIP